MVRDRAWIAAAVLAGFLCLAADASASRQHVVSVSSPRDGGFVVERPGKPITLTLRLSSGARVRRALVNGHSVSVAGVARGGRTRRLTVARKRLRRGSNTLIVQARAGSGKPNRHTAARFTLARKTRGLLRSVRPRDGARLRPGPVRLRFRAARTARLRLWVNGRTASGRLHMLRAGRWGAELSPLAGLRFGRNVVRVRALDPARGRVQQVRRVVRVARSGPIADAGRDAQVVAGRAIRLDSRASLQAPASASAAATVRRRWKLVDSPRRSRAKLRGRTSVRPLLTTSAPGTYTLQLTATSGGVSSTDTVDVSAGPSAPVQPAAIPATQAGTTGIQLGPTFAPATAGATGVQVAVVERSTLGLVSNTTYAPTDMQSLANDIAELSQSSGSSVLVAMNGLGGAGAVSQGQQPFLQVALAEIGAGPGSTASGIAVLGIPERAPGTAWATPSGTLSGSLTIDSNGNWTFVYGDDVTYDTQAAPPAGVQNRVTVGTATYDVPATSVGGFQVVTLDAQTLAGTSNFYPTQSTNPQGLLDMFVALEQAEGAGDLVIVTSVGQPLPGPLGIPNTPPWSQVALALTTLGANADTLAELGAVPSNTYALVAPAAPGGQVAEASNIITSGGTAMGGGTGAITGVLSRGAQGAYAPVVNSYAGEPNLGLSVLAFQAPTAWPAMATSGQQAAYAYISRKLDIGCDAAGSCDVRSEYGNPSLKNSWGAVSVSYPGGSPGFTQTEFQSVKAQLGEEFRDVVTVWTFLGNLSAPLTDDSAQNYADLEEIAANIQTAITPPPSASGVVADVLTGLSDLLWLASVAAAPEAVEVVGAGLALGSDLVTDAAGNPVPPNVQASADQIALQWADNMVDAAAQLNNLAPIFVSDWGKLSTAAANATGGDWTFSQQDLDGLGTSIEQGAAQTAYDSLMPVGYTTYQLCPNRIDPDPVSAGDYYAGSSPLGGVYQPFRGIPEAGQTMLLAVGPIGPVGTLYAMQAPPSTPFGGGAPLPSPSLNPPSSLVTPLFQSVNQSGGIGLYPPYFWERYMLPPDLFLSDDYPPAKTCPPLTSP